MTREYPIVYNSQYNEGSRPYTGMSGTANPKYKYGEITVVSGAVCSSDSIRITGVARTFSPVSALGAAWVDPVYSSPNTYSRGICEINYLFGIYFKTPLPDGYCNVYKKTDILAADELSPAFALDGYLVRKDGDCGFVKKTSEINIILYAVQKDSYNSSRTYYYRTADAEYQKNTTADRDGVGVSVIWAVPNSSYNVIQTYRETCGEYYPDEILRVNDASDMTGRYEWPKCYSGDSNCPIEANVKHWV